MTELQVRQGYANGTLTDCDECGATMKNGGECEACKERVSCDVLVPLYKPNGTVLAEGEAGIIEAISHEFAIRLSMEIGDDNLREVVRRNATSEYAPTCCASHDFCDANMVMLGAMRAWGHDLFTPEGDISNDETRICNAAWEQAKEYCFDL